MSNPIEFRYRHLSGLHLVGFLAIVLFVLITTRFPRILLWAGLIVLVPFYGLLIWRRIQQRRERNDLVVVGTLSRNELSKARAKLKRNEG